MIDQFTAIALLSGIAVAAATLAPFGSYYLMKRMLRREMVRLLIYRRHAKEATRVLEAESDRLHYRLSLPEVRSALRSIQGIEAP
jgi:hypothetical protein